MNTLRKLYLKYVTYRFTSKPIFTKKVLSSPNYFIGEHTYGWPTVLFGHLGTQLTIGNYCSIAYGVKIFLGGNHRTDWVSTYPFHKVAAIFEKGASAKDSHTSKGNVVIGNDVWIGYGAMILSGVTIGDGAVIGANALVAKDVAPYEIVAGNPAVVLKKRFNDDIINELLQIRWWDWSDGKINENIHLLCSGHIDEFIKTHRAK